MEFPFGHRHHHHQCCDEDPKPNPPPAYQSSPYATNEYPPPPSSYQPGYGPPPPPYGGGPDQPSYPYQRPPSHAHHASHENYSSIASLLRQPSVRVYTKADENYSLSIRDGQVVLVPANPRDEYQVNIFYRIFGSKSDLVN